MLEGIRDEFKTVRENFKWSRMVHTKTVKPCFDEIIEKNPNMKAFKESLDKDWAVFKVFNELIVNKSASLKSALNDIYDQLMLRINVSVWRNSGTWLETRKKDDKHWARFWSMENLPTEIERCDKAIQAVKGSSGPKIKPGGTIDVAAPREYDFLDLVDLAIQNGKATEREGEIFLFWLPVADHDNCDQVTCDKFNIELAELGKCIQKFSDLLS